MDKRQQRPREPAPHLIERRDIDGQRRQRLFEELFSQPLGNAKWERRSLELAFDAQAVRFVRAMVDVALKDPSNALQDFLTENPWPEALKDLPLTAQERASVLVMNALKVWLSKEQAFLDTLFTGGQFRKKLRTMAIGRQCPGCGEPFTTEAVEFHHTVRDGRPPVPICKDCHKALERQRNAGQCADAAPESKARTTIRSIREKRRASWTNLLKAVRSLLDMPHDPFGTRNVENSTKSIVRLMCRQTGLSLCELKAELEALAIG